MNIIINENKDYSRKFYYLIMFGCECAYFIFHQKLYYLTSKPIRRCIHDTNIRICMCRYTYMYILYSNKICHLLASYAWPQHARALISRLPVLVLDTLTGWFEYRYTNHKQWNANYKYVKTSELCNSIV